MLLVVIVALLGAGFASDFVPPELAVGPSDRTCGAGILPRSQIPALHLSKSVQPGETGRLGLLRFPPSAATSAPSSTIAALQGIEDQAEYDRAQKGNGESPQEAARGIPVQLLCSKPASQETAQDADDGVADAPFWAAPLDRRAREGAGKEADHNPTEHFHVRHGALLQSSPVGRRRGPDGRSG
jgi:hypothetical protein